MVEGEFKQLVDHGASRIYTENAAVYTTVYDRLGPVWEIMPANPVTRTGPLAALTPEINRFSRVTYTGKIRPRDGREI